MRKSWLLRLCAAVFVFAIVMIFQKTANAQASEMISWVNSMPSAYSSTVMDGTLAGCDGSIRITDVKNIGQKKICLQSSGNIKFGSYFNGHDMSWVTSVGPGNEIYQFDGVCDYYDACLYLPASDILIWKSFYNYPFGRTMAVYKNFSKRLIRRTSSLGFLNSYGFDLSNPDYRLLNDNGGIVNVNAAAASNNGKWLAVEFKSMGVGVLNLETFQMRQVAPAKFFYGYGTDPYVNFAISNDGRHLVTMGYNVGFELYDIDDNCGESLNNQALYNGRPLKNPCRTGGVNHSEYIKRYNFSSLPKFSDDGGELSFYAYSYNGEVRAVVLRAAGYETKSMDYIALGDSYSSGQGETDDGYYLNGTNERYENCHLSYRSYPFLISDWTGIDPLSMASVACSGAETEDIMVNGSRYSGQNDRLGENGLNLTRNDQITTQIEAKRLFIPGRVQQEEFVKKYHPKLITIGIGGNDIGFADKLKSCINVGTCDWAGDAIYRAKAANEIKDLFPTLVDTYQRLHNASPSTRIIAIGYPRIINALGECNLAENVALNETERQFIVESTSYLNDVVEAAAKTAGVGFVDIENSYGDQVICGSKSPSAANSVRFGDDMPSFFRVIGSESFHPTPLGHYFAAKKIMETTKNIRAYDYCTNGKVFCPNESIKVPEPSDYWGSRGNGVALLKKVNFAYNGADQYKKHIQINDNILEPNSVTRIEVTSSPREVGTFTTNGDGGLNVDIELPTDLEYGYHTLHLYDKTYSGRQIEFYQLIEICEPKPVIVEQPIIDSIHTKNNKTKSAQDNTKPKSEVRSDSSNVIVPGSSSQNGGSILKEYEKSDNRTDKPEVKGKSIVSDQPKKTDDVGGQYDLNGVFKTFLLSAVSLLGVITLAYKVVRGRAG